MADADVTLQEAADLLGVHYMTAYRYVRLGLLPADKVGGSWRVRRNDLIQFRNGDTATSSTTAPGHRHAPWAERLEARLVAGDNRGAWGVVEAALAAGTDVDVLYLDVIAPAMASIGDRWATGELDISAEHRASGIVIRIMGRLGARFGRRGRARGSVVLGAPSGERHSLPVSMLADLVRGAGFEVSDLGADVPPGSFVHAALGEVDRLVAVGVSVTTEDGIESAAEALALLRAALPGVALFVGGQAVSDEAHALALGADAYAADGRGVVALLDRAVRGSRRAEGGSAAG